MLENLGLNKKWIHWIKQCISCVSFSVLLNGILDDFFFSSRSIRQRDPLSPYIIISAELPVRKIYAHSLSGEKLLEVKLSRWY